MIIFGNGVELQEVNVIRTSERYEGCERTVLEFMFDAAVVDQEEVEAIYDNPDALSTIKIKQYIVNNNAASDENEATAEDIEANSVTYVYKDFTIPIIFITKKTPTNKEVGFRVTQKTTEEKLSEEMVKTSETACLAITDLAAMVDLLMTDYTNRMAASADN